MTSPLENLAETTDQIIARLSHDETVAFLDALPSLTRLLTSAEVQTIADAVRAVSSPKATAAFDRAMGDLGQLAKLCSAVPAGERQSYITVRKLDAARAAKAPVSRAPRVPRETSVDMRTTSSDGSLTYLAGQT